MPLQATSGAASYDAYGGGAAAVPNYIEDVFSTYLYTGNGSTQTITNGIDLAGKGGLTWIKRRDVAGYDHCLFDTARGISKMLQTDNTTASQTITGYGVTAFGATGFSVTDFASTGYGVNETGALQASWTFRKQPKFYTQGTYTGNGVQGRGISHDLGSTPGCIIVKKTSGTGNWVVYHSGAGTSGSVPKYLLLNTTDGAQYYDNTTWSAVPTSTEFFVGTDLDVNANGASYVYYMFAHNAGGFGLTGTDNVISCGSFSGNTTVTLGWEPQWVLMKAYDVSDSWYILDNMRGWTNNGSNGNDAYLNPNSSGAETAGASMGYPTATGFTTYGFGGANAIYIAIRRGPMKVPTSGTSVFAPVTYTGTSANRTITSPGFPVDFVESKTRNATYNDGWFDRLRGATIKLSAVSTGAEVTQSDSLTGFDSMTGYSLGADTAGGSVNESPKNYVNWAFRRAPNFFDEVCYTSDGTYNPINHNLTVVPELVIQKIRNGGGDWYVYNGTQYGYLNTTSAFANFSRTLTATTFVPITQSGGNTFVTYLFASCPGVSKVGSYTGNGSTQTINCGFTGGARFVLIKRTDAAGDWYVWDTARGIVSGNDPHLSLNTTAAEVTTDDTIDPDNTGFIVNQLSATNVNVSSATYIYLAIA